jgi:hypothetical protein
MNDRDTIERAKAALPLPELWRKLGWAGEPKKSCRVPYRPDDARESGSVFLRASGQWCFHDFKGGETFDEIALLAHVESLSNGDACRRFLELAGITGTASAMTAPPSSFKPRPPVVAPDTKPPCKPYLGTLREPTLAECETLADVRNLSPDAVKAAACDGLLRIGERLGCASWVLTDETGWNAQFRRLDGLPYVLTDGREVKTLGVKGGWAAWPLGLPVIAAANYPLAVLVEGTPDALAAFQVIAEAGMMHECGVVCMAGAGLRIPAECLPVFNGRRVRIFADADESGRAAAVRWECQLREHGARVDAYDLAGLLQDNGKPVKDLNDACRMAAPERAALGLMEGMTA